MLGISFSSLDILKYVEFTNNSLKFEWSAYRMDFTRGKTNNHVYVRRIM